MIHEQGIKYFNATSYTTDKTLASPKLRHFIIRNTILTVVNGRRTEVIISFYEEYQPERIDGKFTITTECLRDKIVVL